MSGKRRMKDGKEELVRVLTRLFKQAGASLQDCMTILAPLAATDKLMEFNGWLLDKYDADGRLPDMPDMISYTVRLTGAKEVGCEE